MLRQLGIECTIEVEYQASIGKNNQPSLDDTDDMATVKNPFDILKKNYDDKKNKITEGEDEGELQQNFGYILIKKKQEFDDKWKRKPISNADNVKLYLVLKAIGAGSFGKVLLVKHKENKEYYAMKVMSKDQILKQKQLNHTYNEKRLLQCINFPFVVNMYDCMKDNSYIYFVMPFISGGEMFVHLRRAENFPEDQSKFYAVQVLLALQYLHYSDLIFRDLKPENIVMSCDGYIKVTDFGFCKMVKGRTWTLCGTPEYIAPEIILSKGYGKSVDWWSFGILVYEMNAGFPPFYSSDHMKLYEKIVAGKFKFPSQFSYDLKDLIKNLLQVDLSKRIGNLKGGVDDIKRAAWFDDIDMMAVYHKQVDAIFKPVCKDPEDLSNFSKCDKDTEIVVGEVERYGKEFADF